jgi:hypothetical protein
VHTHYIAFTISHIYYSLPNKGKLQVIKYEMKGDMSKDCPDKGGVGIPEEATTGRERIPLGR